MIMNEGKVLTVNLSKADLARMLRTYWFAHRTSPNLSGRDFSINTDLFKNVTSPSIAKTSNGLPLEGYEEHFKRFTDNWGALPGFETLDEAVFFVSFVPSFSSTEKLRLPAHSWFKMCDVIGKVESVGRKFLQHFKIPFMQ